jgi:hypothetical protein
MASGREGMIEAVDREIAIVQERLKESRSLKDEHTLAVLERIKACALLVFQQHDAQMRPPGVTLH